VSGISHQSQLDRIYRRLLMLSAPVLIATIDDSQPIQIAQIRINDTPEVIDNVPLMQLYGLSSFSTT
jgi:phage gp45-like